MQSACIFCDIISGILPATVVADYGDILIIRDRAPKAPTHLLIIPKKHRTDIRALQPDDAVLAGQLLMAAHAVSREFLGLQDFRLVINNGSEVGQSVFHLHMHLLSGKKMVEL